MQRADLDGVGPLLPTILAQRSENTEGIDRPRRRRRPARVRANAKEPDPGRGLSALDAQLS